MGATTTSFTVTAPAEGSSAAASLAPPVSAYSNPCPRVFDAALIQTAITSPAAQTLLSNPVSVQGTFTAPQPGSAYYAEPVDIALRYEANVTVADAAAHPHFLGQVKRSFTGVGPHAFEITVGFSAVPKQQGCPYLNVNWVSNTSHGPMSGISEPVELP